MFCLKSPVYRRKIKHLYFIENHRKINKHILDTLMYWDAKIIYIFHIVFEKDIKKQEKKGTNFANILRFERQYIYTIFTQNVL